MRLHGKTCLVTGGGSGLGQATVEALLRRGANVAALDRNPAPSLMGRAGVLTHTVDVTDEQAVRKSVAAAVERFGTLDVCVHCAGLYALTPLLSAAGHFDCAPVRKVLDVNLLGTFIVCGVVAEQMAKNAPDPDCGERGVILNTASVRAFEGGAGGAAYAASKGGVASLTLCLARELAERGIRVNTIAPGLMDTAMFANLSAEAIASYLPKVPFPKRLGRADEFAELACHVVENAYLNGEVVRLDAAFRG